MNYKKILLSVILCISCLLAFSSCTTPAPSIDEVRDELTALIEASYEINDLFFGEGLPIDEDAGLMLDGVEGYDYVSLNDAKYRSIYEIKVAAEEVYSPDYLEYIYETIFSGHADPAVGILTARFIEEEGMLMQMEDLEPLYNGVRKYDYSSMRIVKPSRADMLNVEITAWVEGATQLETVDGMSDEFNDIISGKKHTVKLAFVKVGERWYLDTPTY